MFTMPYCRDDQQLARGPLMARDAELSGPRDLWRKKKKKKKKKCVHGKIRFQSDRNPMTFGVGEGGEGDFGLDLPPRPSTNPEAI